MRINDGNIKEMLQKYMDGMTSVEEESMLAQYFRKAGRKAAPDGIAEDDWQAYKEMFAMFDSGSRQRKTVWLRWCAVAAVAAVMLIGVWRLVELPDSKPDVDGKEYAALTAKADSVVQNTNVDSTRIEMLPTKMPAEQPSGTKKSVKKRKHIRSTSMPIPRHYLAKMEKPADTIAVDIEEAVRQADLLMHAVYIQQQSDLNDILRQGNIIMAGLDEYIGGDEEYEEIDVY